MQQKCNMEGLALALVCAEGLWLGKGLLSLGMIVQANRMGQEGKEKATVHRSSFKIRMSALKRQSFLLYPGSILRSILGTGRFKSKSNKIPILSLNRYNTVLCPWASP